MSGSIFRLFVKRAAIVMSSIDLTLPHLPPLPDNLGSSIPFKLLNASNALLTLYNSDGESKKLSFREIVKENQLFVYNAVKLACHVLQFYGKLVWTLIVLVYTCIQYLMLPRPGFLYLVHIIVNSFVGVSC